jgi:hypothetical protein
LTEGGRPIINSYIRYSNKNDVQLPLSYIPKSVPKSSGIKLTGIKGEICPGDARIFSGREIHNGNLHEILCILDFGKKIIAQTSSRILELLNKPYLKGEYNV